MINAIMPIAVSADPAAVNSKQTPSVHLDFTLSYHYVLPAANHDYAGGIPDLLRSLA